MKHFENNFFSWTLTAEGVVFLSSLFHLSVFCKVIWLTRKTLASLWYLGSSLGLHRFKWVICKPVVEDLGVLCLVFTGGGGGGSKFTLLLSQTGGGVWEHSCPFPFLLWLLLRSPSNQPYFAFSATCQGGGVWGKGRKEGWGRSMNLLVPSLMSPIPRAACCSCNTKKTNWGIIYFFLKIF